MYDNFYFLHIDKTVGKLMGLHMTDPMYSVMEENGVSALKLNANHSEHNFWRDLSESTYIYSTIRNPLHRYISDFLHSVSYSNNEDRMWGGGKDITCPYFTIDNLRIWMKDESKHNYQYKQIASGDLDKESVFNKLKRINLLIRSEDLVNNQIKVQNTIMEELKINKKYNIFNPDYETVFYEETTNDFIHFNIHGKDIEEEIRNLNQLDYEIYNSVFFRNLNL